MSTTVDNKVVEMRFDNQQFERNANQSISTLDRLKQALVFGKSVTSGFADIEKGAKRLDLSFLSRSIDDISNRFNNLGIIGITALQRITNAAITTGKNIISALTIDPVKTGLEEYETKINAIQVIRANDQVASMDDISSALNELNAYADKTIYNFAQMTSNVGKFVAQGLGVEEAANAVKGMANLAAASGASASDMARATYQMSQALGGVIRKIDVNSLRNANMWTTTLKDTLIDVARAEGVAIDKMIEEKGTLEETLEKGWLTGQMFTKAMNIYSGVYDEAQLRAMGFNDEQIQKFKVIAKTAEDAAVQIKTFSQLIDTLKENVQSGWTQTWETIIGNFEEARELWTNISNLISDILNESADARNKLLSGWKDLGGRDDLLAGLSNIFFSFLFVINAVKAGFRDIFPETTVDRIVEITRAFRALTERLIVSEDLFGKIRFIASSVFSVIHFGIQIIGIFASGIAKLAFLFGPIISEIGQLVLVIAKIIKSFSEAGTAANSFSNGINGLVSIISKPLSFAVNLVATAISKIRELLASAFLEKDAEKGFSGIGTAAENVSEQINPLGKAIQFVSNAFSGLKNVFSAIGPAIVAIANAIGGAFDSIASSIIGAFKNADFNTVMNFVKTGLVAGIAVGLKKFADKLTSPVDILKDLAENVSDIFGNLGDALSSFTDKIKSGLLLKIAIAVGILALSLIALSGIEPGALAKSIGAITVLFGELFGMLALLEKFLKDAKFKSAGRMSKIFLSLSISVAILASALRKLSSINADDLGKGLIAVTVLLGEMVAAAVALSKFGGKIKTSSIGIVLFAVAINVLVNAVKKLGELDSNQLIQGLEAVGAIMAELAAFMFAAKFGKFGALQGLAIIELAAALLLLQKAVKAFGEFDAGVLKQGLLGVGAILAEIAVFANFAGNAKHVLSSAASVLLISFAMTSLAKAMGTIGSMPLPTLAKGIAAIGASLLIFVLALNNMHGGLKNAAALFVLAIALNTMVPVIQALGSMDILKLVQGLGALAAVFIIIGVAGKLLAPSVLAIIGLGAALMMIGAGVALVSTGLLILSTAIMSLVIVLQTLGSALTDSFVIMATGLGAGFATFLITISGYAPQLAEAFKNIVLAIIDALVGTIPNLVNAAMQLLSSLLNAFLEYVPNMVDAGLKLIAGILEGIALNIQSIVEAAISVVVNFIEGVAVMIPFVLQAGMDLMLSFINGLADTIRNNTDLVISAIENLFSAIVEAALKALATFTQDLFTAGADAVGGLIEGIQSGIHGVIEAAENLGKSVLDALGKIVGWASPWEETEVIGRDAGPGLANGIREGTSEAEDAAEELGVATINAANNVVSDARGVGENIGGEIAGGAKDKVQDAEASGTALGSAIITKADEETTSGYQRLADQYNTFMSQFRKQNLGTEDIEAEQRRRNNKKMAAAIAAKEAADAAASEAKAPGSIKSSGGGGGGGASKVTKEVKKLFDVLKDGKKVIEAFQENFGSAYEQIGDTEKFDIAKNAVQKLAEAIYAESVKSVDAATQAAKTSEEKLAEMRDAFISFSDGIKTSIANAIDEFGKFSIGKSTFGSIKDWQKSLDDQKNGLLAWDRELRRFAKRTDNYNLYEMVLKWGPERLSDLRILNSATDKEFKRISESMVEVMGDGVNSLSEVITNNALANAAFIFEEAHKTTEDTEEAVEESLEEASEAVAKVTDNTVGRFVATTKNGYAVVSASQASVVKGQNSFTESIKDTIKVTDQLKAKALSIYDDVSSSIESALTGSQSFFEKFDTESELTGTDLIDAAKSNNKTFEEWGDMLSELMFRGIDTKLAEELYNAGIDSYDKVKAIYEMDESELEQYNMLYKKFQELPKSISDQVGEAAAAAGLMLANGFVNSFSIDPAYNQAKEYALATVRALKEGVEDPVNGAASVAKATAEATGNGIKDNTDIVNRAALEAMNNSVVVWEAHAKKAFKVVGEASMAGMAEGVSENAYRVVNAFGDVTDSGVNETEEGLDINSPSKVFAKIGEYCMLGFANGITDNSDKVGSSAIDSMKAIVGHIADIINGEVQVDPTIRPVMDLSGIDDGVSAIDSMFGGRSYALSRGINIQNRTNSMNDMMSQMAANQAAMIQNSNRAPINMYVYAAPGQSEQEIADIVEQKFMARFNSGRAVWT